MSEYETTTINTTEFLVIETEEEILIVRACEVLYIRHEPRTKTVTIRFANREQPSTSMRAAKIEVMHFAADDTFEFPSVPPAEAEE